LCQRPNGRAVNFGNTCGEVEVTELDEVPELFPSGVNPHILMLMGEILVRFGEAGRRETLIKKWLVITTTKESIRAIDNPY
jgi:hypothetical protein